MFIVHGKDIVTAVSVQNICAKLKKCAHLEGAGSYDCVVQWSSVRTTRKLVMQTTKACEAVAGLSLRPEIQPTDTVVMPQL